MLRLAVGVEHEYGSCIPISLSRRGSRANKHACHSLSTQSNQALLPAGDFRFESASRGSVTTFLRLMGLRQVDVNTSIWASLGRPDQDFKTKSPRPIHPSLCTSQHVNRFRIAAWSCMCVCSLITRIAVERATCPTRLFKFSNVREQYFS
jgi:hypothetical protein